MAKKDSFTVFPNLICFFKTQRRWGSQNSKEGHPRWGSHPPLGVAHRALVMPLKQHQTWQPFPLEPHLAMSFNNNPTLQSCHGFVSPFCQWLLSWDKPQVAVFKRIPPCYIRSKLSKACSKQSPSWAQLGINAVHVKNIIKAHRYLQ